MMITACSARFSPHSEFRESLKNEHEASLAVVLPLNALLVVTDRLIDQVVYQLYGLTEEEIAVVEGRSDRAGINRETYELTLSWSKTHETSFAR